MLRKEVFSFLFVVLSFLALSPLFLEVGNYDELVCMPLQGEGNFFPYLIIFILLDNYHI